jgi:hypothetical protein
MGVFTVNTQAQALASMQESRWSLFPNPTDSEVQLLVEGNWNNDEKITLQLMSSEGRLIHTYQGSLQQANSDLNNGLSLLSGGIYYIRVVAADTQVLRVVKN